MTPREVLEFAKKNKTVMVDMRFMDFPGLWQHFSIPITALDVSSFEEGSDLTAQVSAAGRQYITATCSLSLIRLLLSWIHLRSIPH